MRIDHSVGRVLLMLTMRTELHRCHQLLAALLLSEWGCDYQNACCKHRLGITAAKRVRG